MATTWIGVISWPGSASPSAPPRSVTSAVVGDAAAQAPQGPIPETPVKFGHIRSSRARRDPRPALAQGHTLRRRGDQRAGGLLGKRKIETITADEAAGPRRR